MIKTWRFELTGLDRETFSQWLALSDECREAYNTCWQVWEAEHVRRRSHAKLKRFAQAMRDYHQQPKAGKNKDDRPKLDIQPTDKQIDRAMYDALRDRCEMLHGDTQSQILNLVRQRMRGKDSEGRWQMWQAVLLGRQGRPSVTRGAPIPFRVRQAQLVAESGKTYLRIGLNCERGHRVTARLLAKHSSATILARIVSGEYKLKGSSIMYEKTARKWYALLSYEYERERAALDKTKRAIVFPGREDPFLMVCGARQQFLMGRGESVAFTRRRLLSIRFARQELYRYAPSDAKKGRGRKRAIKSWAMYERDWNNFCQTFNHTLTRRIVDWCIQERVGTLRFLLPAGRRAETRFLSHAGKLSQYRDSTGWQWSRLAAILQYKCKEAGIHLEVKRCGDARGGTEVESKLAAGA